LDLKKTAAAAVSTAATAGIAAKVKEAVSGPTGKKVDTGDLSVSIHVPTLNEERYIDEALNTLNRQSLVRNSDVKIVVLDSGSRDSTVEKAKEAADEVWSVPKGKLSARHTGLLRSNADIVVSTDADCRYPEGWLNEILAPFTDPEVVMTHGPKVQGAPGYREASILYNSFLKKRQVSASNSALRRTAYLETKGLRRDINQLHRKRIWLEEEFEFPDRMRETGEIKYAPNAVCYEHTRNLPGATDSKYVEQIKRGERF